MAKRHRSFRGTAIISGHRAGRAATSVYLCEGCQRQYGTPPSQCRVCGRMDFKRFDSIGEAGRWCELLLRQRAGLISNIDCQVRFPLLAFGQDGLAHKVGEYWADFTYMRDGQLVIEDFKGAITDLAAWKLRHMEAQGLPVSIIKK
jgi:hypothetical protein